MGRNPDPFGLAPLVLMCSRVPVRGSIKPPFNRNTPHHLLHQSFPRTFSSRQDRTSSTIDPIVAANDISSIPERCHIDRFQATLRGPSLKALSCIFRYWCPALRFPPKCLTASVGIPYQ